MSVRVAFLQASLGIGGAERLVQTLALSMDRARIEPVAICLYEAGPVGEELRAAGVTVTDRLARSRSDLAAGRRLREALARERIDVVYAIDSPLPLLWAGFERRRAPRPALVLGFHSTGRAEDPLQHFLSSRVAFPVVDRFVALADSHREWMAAHLKVARERIDVIVSGTDLEAFAPVADRAARRAELGLPAGAPLAAIVAALRPEKNHALFVEAAARVHAQLPAARFLVVGDGAGRAAIEAGIAARGLGDVVLMLGARRDMPRLWPAIDVAVLSSHARVETLPVTLIEAHACGVPAVATRVGSVADVVEDGVTGCLVPPGDADALAARLAALLADGALRARMGEAARARALRCFDRRVMVRAYEDLFVRSAGARP